MPVPQNETVWVIELFAAPGATYSMLGFDVTQSPYVQENLDKVKRLSTLQPNSTAGDPYLGSRPFGVEGNKLVSALMLVRQFLDSNGPGAMVDPKSKIFGMLIAPIDHTIRGHSIDKVHAVRCNTVAHAIRCFVNAVLV